MQVSYQLQPETANALNSLPKKTVSEQSAMIGLKHGEPLLVAMDAMLRYAKAYQRQYESTVGEDGVLGDHFKAVIDGLRGLCNGDGAVAMELDRTTDSKDNGVIESLYWRAMEVGNFDEC